LKRAISRAPSEDDLAKAIYDALASSGKNAYFGAYNQSGRTIIDGRFNLALAAAFLLDRFWPSVPGGAENQIEQQVK
jgi:hypothetical protein